MAKFPVETVSADELPRERGLQYDEVIRIIGRLYLDSHHSLNIAEERFNAVVRELEQKISQLQSENSLLKEQLRNASERNNDV